MALAGTKSSGVVKRTACCVSLGWEQSPFAAWGQAEVTPRARQGWRWSGGSSGRGFWPRKLLEAGGEVRAEPTWKGRVAVGGEDGQVSGASLHRGGADQVVRVAVCFG